MLDHLLHRATLDDLSLPMRRCPRCERGVDPADLLAQPLAELRLIDPHVARYDRQTPDGRVAICDDCDQQLAAIALEMDTQRRRLARLWPQPTSPRARLMDDQCLSRTFEALRDLHIEDVLGRPVRPTRPRCLPRRLRDRRVDHPARAARPGLRRPGRSRLPRPAHPRRAAGGRRQ